MRTLELFAGAGGAALGLKAAGCEAIACYEWDKDACDTLKANGFPGFQVDVREARWHGWSAHYGTPDLMWASPPCQAFSQAGTRLGAVDPRNGWPWTLDCIDAVHPTWVICENVPGLTHHSTTVCGDPDLCPGCYWERVLIPAFELRFAHVQVWKLNAADFGVPQTRKRVFLVCGPKPVRPPSPTHAHPSECNTLFGELKPWMSMGEALGLHDVEDGERRQGNRNRNRNLPWRTVSGGGNTMVVGGGHNPNHPGDVRRYRDLTDGPSTTIAAQMAGNAGPFVVSPTICGGDGHGLGSGATRDLVESAIGRRRLSVEECAVLQDFPVGFSFCGTKASQYRQVGNAVPPSLVKAIAQVVVEAQ